MSTLWDAEVISKNGTHVDVRVRACHPDSGEFDESKRFAFRLLYDEAFEYEPPPSSARTARGPLGEEIHLDQTFDDRFLDQNVDRFIVALEVTDARNGPVDEQAVRASIDRELLDLGVRRDDREAWDNAWSEHWTDFWNDPLRTPTATYKIEVTDPRWIAHLKVGQRWDSAAY
jgi:hypothetical protein